MATGAVQAMLDVPIGNVDLVAFIVQMYRTSAMLIGLPMRRHRRHPGATAGPSPARSWGTCPRAHAGSPLQPTGSSVKR